MSSPEETRGRFELIYQDYPDSLPYHQEAGHQTDPHPTIAATLCLSSIGMVKRSVLVSILFLRVSF